MHVKIGDVTYNSSEQPIMLVMSDGTKEMEAWMGEPSHEIGEFDG